MTIPAESVVKMLLIANAKKVENSQLRFIAKFDAKTLRKLSGRKRLTEEFMAALALAFAEYGWHFGLMYGEEDTFFVHHDVILEGLDKVDLTYASDLVKHFDGKTSIDDIEQAMEKIDEEFWKWFGGDGEK